MATRPFALTGPFAPVAVSRVPRSRRTMRSPRHEFYVRTFPWVIQPIGIAPVIPGETLKSAKFQYRVVTDPLDSKLVGWWTELHVFYVKHRDIDAHAGNTNFQDMMLQPDTPLQASTVSGGGGSTYRLNGRADHTKMAYDCVVDWYFRDEGEFGSDHVEAITGMPLQRLGREDWLDSMLPTANVDDADFAVDINNDGTITASEIDESMRQYMLLVSQGVLVDMTYEDYLATYGVNPGRVAVNRPELLRSVRKWTQPTNTVTQGTGAVTSACVWSIEEAISRKDYFFKEPGYILALMVTKPKVYRRRQTGAAVNLLDNAYLWLPSALREDLTSSLVGVDTVSGPFGSVTANGGLYTVDARDIFIHGDQFLQAAPSVAGADSVAAGGVWGASLPAVQTDRMAVLDGIDATTGRPDYPLGTAAERSRLFTGSTAETQCIEAEGYMTFQIATTTVDMTPGQPQRNT